MSGFAVDLDELAAAATALDQSRTVMSEWDTRKSQLSGAAASAGHRTMTDAIRQFCDEWDYGFGLLADDIENLVAAIEQAATTYANTETTIVDATRPDPTH